MIASVDRLFTQPAQNDPLGLWKGSRVSESNGADIGQVLALLSDVLVGLRQFQQQVADSFAAIERRFEAIDRRFEAIERRLQGVEQEVATLRQDVADYHSAVVGHGILISELDVRVSRIERHLACRPQGRPALSLPRWSDCSPLWFDATRPARIAWTGR